MACSGAFGTPGWVRTSGLSLRRRPLYPTELRGLIQKIFNFRVQPDSNELPLRRRALYPGEVQGHVLNFPRMEDGLLIFRRRPLYPGEVRGHEPKYFTPFVRACQLRKTAHVSCAEASHQKPPPSWTPGGGAEHRRRAAYPFRRLCYTISWDNWEEGFVKKHNFRQSHQIYYLYLQHKSSKIFRINAYHNALCILFFLPKKLFQNQLCPRRPDRKVNCQTKCNRS